MAKAVRIGATWTRATMGALADAGFFAGAACMAFVGALGAERVLIAVFG